MIDLDRIQGFDWDHGNVRKNSVAHDVSQVEAEQIFFNEPLLLTADDRHSGVERRLHALGRTNAPRSLHVTFTLRAGDTLIRVISARDMSRKERASYDKSA